MGVDTKHSVLRMKGRESLPLPLDYIYRGGGTMHFPPYLLWFRDSHEGP